MSNEPHPVCDRCHQRIHLFECIWREFASGEVRSAYALDLPHITCGPRRVWHPGCHPHAHAVVAA